MAERGNRAYIWLAVSSIAQTEPDKVSMEEQEAVCRAWCEQRGLAVHGVLTVPGLSRSESDIFDLFEEYASKGITAYSELRKLWKAKAFDWLVCYIDERLGRSTSLYSHTIENVIRSGARIASVINGVVIDDDNVEQFIAMGGYATSMDIKKFRKRREMGMRARAERGQKTGSKIPFGFAEGFDPRYKKPVLKPDPACRRILDDLVTLMLEGVSYHKLESTMLARFGHGRDGKPYSYQFFRSVLHNPASWGHGAQHFRDPKSPNRLRIGKWVYDEAAPLPDGVVMHRRTHEPLFVGEQAERLKAELSRRHDIVGRRRPGDTRAFSGLLVCDECGYYLTCSTSLGRNFDYLRCATRYSMNFGRIGKCTQTAYIRSDRVQAYFHQVLKVMLETNDLGEFGGADTRALQQRLASLDADLDAADKRLKRLIQAVKTVDPDNPAWMLYTDEIRGIGEQIKATGRVRLDTERALLEADTADQLHTLEEIRALTLERFWLLPSRQINQMLLRLIGQYRVSAADGEFRDVIVAPPTRHAV